MRWILLPRVEFGGSFDQAFAYIRENPDAEEWSDWHAYDSPEGRAWTPPPLDYGFYLFAVQAKDEAGAVTAVWGFAPVYFEPDEVQAALQIILHDEWKLPRR